MQTFLRSVQSATLRRTPMHHAACAALATALLAPGPLSAQHTLPPVTVTGVVNNGYGGWTGGNGWIGTWDTDTDTWSWQYWGPNDVPPPRPGQEAICAELTEQWYTAGCQRGSNGLHVGSNGCGPGGILGWALVPESPMPNVSFNSACNQHDLCYGTLHRSRESCDEQFRSGLLQACSLGEWQWRMEARDLGYAPSQIEDYVAGRRRECDGFVNIYHGAVMARGEPAFAAAQRQVGRCHQLDDALQNNDC